MKPNVTTIGDAFQFSWHELGVEASVDRFHESHGNITAELTINSFVPGKEGLLHSAKLNLMSTQARAALAKAVAKRLEGPDWYGLLEQLCFLAVERYREGEPSVDLREVDPHTKPKWLYFPYLEHGGPTMLFAYGASGKSLLALYFGLQVALGAPQGYGKPPHAPVPVIYLDWETSRETHAERLSALCAGMGIEYPEACPPIFYRRMDTSLPQAVPAVRRDIARRKAGLAIVDSAGIASGGNIVDQEIAIQLYAAMRKLGIPILLVHHRPKKTGLKRSGKDDAYGSVYLTNSARNVWQLDAADGEDENRLAIAMIHVKTNNGKLMPRHAYTVEFDNQVDGTCSMIELNKADIAELPELAKRAPLRQRILQELQNGAMTSKDLAEALDESLNYVQVKLSTMKKRREVVNLPGYVWGLPAREEAAAA